MPPRVRAFNISATEPDGSSDYQFASIIFPETYKTSAASCFACGTWGFKLSWYVNGTCGKEGKITCAAHSICYEDPAGIGTSFRCGCASGYYGDGYKNGTACNSEYLSMHTLHYDLSLHNIIQIINSREIFGHSRSLFEIQRVYMLTSSGFASFV